MRIVEPEVYFIAQNRVDSDYRKYFPWDFCNSLKNGIRKPKDKEAFR